MKVWVILASFLVSASALAAEDINKADWYSLNYDAAGAIKAGEASSCKLTIKPAAGHVLKTETPFKAMLKGSDGVKVEKEKYTSKDFEDPKSAQKSIQTKFTAAAAGKHTLNADLTFFVCNDEVCKRFKDKADCAVEAK